MRALRGVLPALLVLIALPLAVTLVEDATLDLVTGRYALVAYAAGAVLAVVFHRSRVVIAAVGLAYLHLARGGLGAEGYVAFATALVVLVGVLAMLRDRGIRSRIGLLQVGASVGALALAHQLLGDPVAVEQFWTVGLLPDFAARALGLPDATVVAAVLALLLATLAVVRYAGPVERALLAVQALVLVASHPALGTSDSSVLLMGAGLLLALSVVEQSYSMAYRDELTKLPGRRALMRELAEATPPFAVAMVDVDHFKKFNDKHGHDVGDQVLQMVATHLAASPDATAYRYGGEEFTLVFPRLTRDEAVPPADAVRVSVQDATFSLRGWTRPRKKPTEAKKKKPRKRRSLAVTVSIGLADSSVGGGSPETVLKKADQALYRAKEEGRNRVST
jgi:diguanylate cyclase (GGDEF)-like protein